MTRKRSLNFHILALCDNIGLDAALFLQFLPFQTFDRRFVLSLNSTDFLIGRSTTVLCPDFIGTRTRHAQMRTLIIRSIVDLITDTSVKIQIHQPLQKEQDMIDRCFGQRIQFPDNSFSETHLHHAIRFIRCGTQPCRHPQGFPSSVGQSPGILLRPCTPPRRSDCTRLL